MMFQYLGKVKQAKIGIQEQAETIQAKVNSLELTINKIKTHTEQMLCISNEENNQEILEI